MSHTLLEFRYFREDDKYQVKCDSCGATDIYISRRPSNRMALWTLERLCSCPDKESMIEFK